MVLDRASALPNVHRVQRARRALGRKLAEGFRQAGISSGKSDLELNRLAHGLGLDLKPARDRLNRTLGLNGVSDDGVMASGLLCGGEIEIFVEPIL